MNMRGGALAGGALAALAAVFVAGVLLAAYDFNYGLAPNECIEFPENPLYTEVRMGPADAGVRHGEPRRHSLLGEILDENGGADNGNNDNYNGVDDPPYRLMHVLPQGAVSLRRALSEAEIQCILSIFTLLLFFV